MEQYCTLFYKDAKEFYSNFAIIYWEGVHQVLPHLLNRKNIFLLW